MRAMILAAGYGTRLWPLTIDRTKPAIPFMGRPLIGYVAEYLARYGFDDIVVNLHHQPESVRTALGDGSDFGGYPPSDNAGGAHGAAQTGGGEVGESVESAGAPLMFTGIQVLDPRVF